MIISESKKLIFVHVQKTAGTSFSQLLEPYALIPSAGRWNKIASDMGLVKDWRKFYFRKHASLRQAEKILPAAIYQNYFKCAFVRNPWDRLVSWYSYVQSTPSHSDCKPGESFNDFAMRFISKSRRAQWWMLENAQGELGMDFIGRFEHLNEDIAHICKMLGIPFTALPHTNKMAKQDFRTFYDDRLAAAVQNAWQTEITYFGYQFES